MLDLYMWSPVVFVVAWLMTRLDKNSLWFFGRFSTWLGPIPQWDRGVAHGKQS